MTRLSFFSIFEDLPNINVTITIIITDDVFSYFSIGKYVNVFCLVSGYFVSFYTRL
ncbi:hypothetical protein ECOK1357_2046 [Escherichia coli OK1357]|nr:hypothetical protein ECOK1357_2046 [Escherichia coli OK1357]